MPVSIASQIDKVPTDDIGIYVSRIFYECGVKYPYYRCRTHSHSAYSEAKVVHLGMESIMHILKVLIGVLSVISMGVHAGYIHAAVLLNRTVEVQNPFHGSPAIGPNLITVGPEIELPNWGGNGYNQLDILDDGFTYTSLQSVQRGSSPNLIQVADTLDVIGSFSSIQIVAASPALNDPTRLYFEANKFWYDVGGIYTNAGDYVQVRITVSGAVPEPTSIFTFSLVISGFCIGYRRCKKLYHKIH